MNDLSGEKATKRLANRILAATFVVIAVIAAYSVYRWGWTAAIIIAIASTPFAVGRR